jgi:thiol:disulfide interchange protein
MYMAVRTLLGIVVLVGLVIGLGGCPAPQTEAGNAPGGQSTTAGPPPAPAAGDNIKWWRDLGRAMQEAKDFKQPLVVDFGAEWCSWCKKLEKETFPAPEVQALKDKFVWARIDTDVAPEPARQYKVEGLPTILVLDSNGKELARNAGFLPPEKMVAFLNEALAKAPK